MTEASEHAGKILGPLLETATVWSLDPGLRLGTLYNLGNAPAELVITDFREPSVAADDIVDRRRPAQLPCFSKGVLAGPLTDRVYVALVPLELGRRHRRPGDIPQGVRGPEQGCRLLELGDGGGERRGRALQAFGGGDPVPVAAGDRRATAEELGRARADVFR